METTEVLYTRNFTDLGPLQSAHILQYALTTDPGCALRYGVSVTVLQAGGRDTQSCRAICDTQEGTLPSSCFPVGKCGGAVRRAGDCGGHPARGPFAVRRGRVSGLYE